MALGGWPDAAIRAGVKPLWASEIEDFPAAVTAHHYPDMKQLGDITKVNGYEIEPVDIICAGSPCQNLSVAGNRTGLKGKESSLFHEAIRIIREMREATNGKYPRFFVWENVPGAFSSNKGLDFKAVLEEIGKTSIPMPVNGKWANAGLVELPSCEIAWRVLDAQYWGVPQRRRRIFLVTDFATSERCAGEILFESEGLLGNTTESGGKEKNTPPDIKGSTGKASRDNKAYSLQGNMIGRKLENGPQGNGINEELSFTLNATDRHAVCPSKA